MKRALALLVAMGAIALASPQEAQAQHYRGGSGFALSIGNFGGGGYGGGGFNRGYRGGYSNFNRGYGGGGFSYSSFRPSYGYGGGRSYYGGGRSYYGGGRGCGY